MHYNPCSLGECEILNTLYTEPTADTEGPPKPLAALTKKSSKNQIYHTAMLGKKAANWRPAPVTRPSVVGADALMEIYCTMGGRWGGEMRHAGL